jgi:hypothetical protein
MSCDSLRAESVADPVLKLAALVSISTPDVVICACWYVSLVSKAEQGIEVVVAAGDVLHVIRCTLS